MQADSTTAASPGHAFVERSRVCRDYRACWRFSCRSAVGAGSGARRGRRVLERRSRARPWVADLQKVEAAGSASADWVKADKQLALEVARARCACFFATAGARRHRAPGARARGRGDGPQGPAEVRQDDLVIVLGVRGGANCGLRAAHRARDARLGAAIAAPQRAGFPPEGSEQVDRGGREGEQSSLQAFGDQITATVNGKRLVDGSPIPPGPGGRAPHDARRPSPRPRSRMMSRRSTTSGQVIPDHRGRGRPAPVQRTSAETRRSRDHAPGARAAAWAATGW